MKVNQLFKLFYRDLAHMKRDLKDGWISKEDLKQRSFGMTEVYHHMLWHCKDFTRYEMRRATAHEKEKFAYFAEGEYTSFDVSLNNKIYKQMNPDLEEIKEGQHYKHKIKPLWILELSGKKFPVFDDDPGQCYYLRLPNGKNIVTSSFCCCPEQEFMDSLFGYLINMETGLYDDADN